MICVCTSIAWSESEILVSALENNAHTNKIVKVEILEGVYATSSFAIRDEGAKMTT